MFQIFSISVQICQVKEYRGILKPLQFKVMAKGDVIKFGRGTRYNRGIDFIVILSITEQEKKKITGSKARLIMLIVPYAICRISDPCNC